MSSTEDLQKLPCRPAFAGLLCAPNYAKSARGGAGWRGVMADHGDMEYASATGNDYPAHEQTYRSFVTLVKGVIAVVVVILILMAIFLA